MIKCQHVEMLNRIVKELFRNGGPQRASAPKSKPKRKEGKSDPALLREQKRLIRSWSK